MVERVFVRLRALNRRAQVDQEIDEEMRFHFDHEVARNIARGMPADEAHFAARRAFGNFSVAAEQARDAIRWSWLEQFG